MHREGMAAWVVLLNAAGASGGDIRGTQGLLRETALLPARLAATVAFSPAAELS